MLTDPKEIEIISRAKQKNVRDPKRSREHFVNIFRDFLSNMPMTGKLLDMGPGQYDFCEMARERGGTCVGMDFDPPVIELGQHKGFETIEGNIQKLGSLGIVDTFDGVFNKFALNAFWFWEDDEKHEAFVDDLCKILKASGWAWIAPWNGVPKTSDISDKRLQEVLDLQHKFFTQRGFTSCDLSERQSRLYGIHGTVANNRVFLRKLSWTNQ